ncbi:Tryptophan--tRNA ligase, mitochondrial, partial [Pseudolycoriella hygida]
MSFRIFCQSPLFRQKQLVPTLKREFSKRKKKQIEWPRKIVSGVQPTGAVHLGNYLGAITRWVDLQNSGENVSFFIADMHSITLPQDPQQLKKNILEMTATLLACGIDPNKSTLFLQSTIKQHAELCWIFGCLTTMARLSHLPQYKEKSATVKEIPLGLFVYPVLQAADILIYKLVMQTIEFLPKSNKIKISRATHVPTGEDQAQQLQLAQHLANVFNFRFGETFPICHGIIADDASCRIRSLRDPTKKMSKSEPDSKSRILLTDPPEQILQKVKKAVTDFTSAVYNDPETRPGVSNLISIHSLMSGLSIEQIVSDVSKLDTGKYKFTVADAVIAKLTPIRLKIEDYLKNPEYLVDVLKVGADKSSQIAEETLVEVKKKVGLGL